MCVQKHECEHVNSKQRAYSRIYGNQHRAIIEVIYLRRVFRAG